MSNIFTQSVTPQFTKQSLSEFFIDPMFMGEDIRGAITVRTDIKGTEKLNRISRPSMITKPKTNPGFTPNGNFTLSTQDITVKPMAIEFEQNGREFWGSVVQQMLASGYKEDDVEQMKNPDIWNKIILPIIAQAGQKDLIRQMWFNDSASADDNYNGYDGFFKHFIAGINNDNVPNISFGSPVPASAEVILEGTMESGSAVRIELNGSSTQILLDATSAASPTAAAAAWVTYANENPTAGFTYSSDGPIITISNLSAFTTTATIVAGTGTATATVQNEIAPSFSIATDEVDATMDQMMAAMPNEMLELNPIFRMSRKAYRNLFSTWKNLGTETANLLQFKGLPTPHYEGVPILIHPEWDTYAPLVDLNSPGQIILTPQANLLFATDGSNDSEMIETWYNQEEQMRRYRVQYKAQTAYLHSELLVLAGIV